MFHRFNAYQFDDRFPCVTSDLAGRGGAWPPTKDEWLVDLGVRGACQSGALLCRRRVAKCRVLRFHRLALQGGGQLLLARLPRESEEVSQWGRDDCALFGTRTRLAQHTRNVSKFRGTGEREQPAKPKCNDR